MILFLTVSYQEVHNVGWSLMEGASNHLGKDSYKLGGGVLLFFKMVSDLFTNLTDSFSGNLYSFQDIHEIMRKLFF